MIKFFARYTKPLLLITTAAVITGCDIGDGNKIESISIGETVDTVRLDDCVGNQLLAIATFTNGSQVNFTDRVNWLSDNPDVATVTTRPTDRPAAFDEDFGFLLPGESAIEGATANISIEYFGLTSDLPLQVTTSGTLVEIGLSINDATMAKGTRQEVGVWGRTSDDKRIALTSQSAFSVTDAAAISLDEDFPGGVTAEELTSTPATLSAVYCQDVDGKEKTASATISVVADSPDGLVLTAADTSLALGTTTELTATATYSNGGTQSRRTSTRFSLTSPGDPAEILFSNSFNIASAIGNFRVTPVATSGTHGVTGQYVDLTGADGSASGTLNITLLNTQLQTPAYRLDRGSNLLVGTNVDLAIIGLFDILDVNAADIGDHEQDLTDFAQITINTDDADKIVIGNGIALGVSSGTSDISVTSATDGFVESETFTLTIHDDTDAVVNSLTVTTEQIRHKVYRLRTVANITPAGGATFDQDVSLNAAWETSDSSIIHVDNVGEALFAVARGGNAGCATVTAHFMGQSGSLAVNSATGSNTDCP